MKLTRLLIIAMLFISTAATRPSVGSPPPAPGGGILLRIHDQAARTTTVTVQMGGHASITAPGLPTLRLTPGVRPDGQLGIAVSAAFGVDGPTGVAKSATEMTVSLGGTLHVEEAGYVLDIDWVDAWESLAPPTSPDNQSECCVVCSGIKTCACRVQAPCGSCCDDECGGCRTPSPSAASTAHHVGRVAHGEPEWITDAARLNR